MDKNKSKVIVVSCDSYEEEKVYNCLKTGIVQLGGIDRFVSKEEKILVKPNFLSTADADSAVVTHPSVIKGMLRLLNENGYQNVMFGDSPGSGSCAGAAKRLGLVGDDTFGASLAPMSEEKKTEFSEGLTCRSFYFTKETVEADAIINLCKMKTHMLERITGAVKNVYGLIAGLRKKAGHVAFPNATVFARMLCDIHRCVKPRLHIMDGVVAMEGNGPGAGTPTPMNVLLFSEDPVALDTVFCYLVNLDPELVPTNSQGNTIGIGTDCEDRIEIVLCSETGDVRNVSRQQLFELYGNADFDVAREKPKKSFLGSFSSIMTKFSRRPYIDKNKCVKCGACISHCPVSGKAVSFKNGKNDIPVYDYKKCIRCYCCQEMCPEHAIRVRGRYNKD